MKQDTIVKFLLRFFDFFVLSYLVFDLGYSIQEDLRAPKLIGLVAITLALLIFNIIKTQLYPPGAKQRIARACLAIVVSVMTLALFIALGNLSEPLLAILQRIRPILESGLVLYFIVRLMVLVRYVYEIYYNPAIVFTGSFFAIILVGAFLLMLPTATVSGISFTDALFTSVSAVCVTGLSVLNLSTDFTFMGQTIVLCLIQIGGLGILTFTSFFAYFFRGGSSFREGLNVRDFTAQENLQDVLKVALNIVAFTFAIEIIGAVMLYASIYDRPQVNDKVFFAVFHSISAFCNAGFSTAANGFAESHLQFNYFLQWIAMALIILGGLGYNIVHNFYQYFKNWVFELMRPKFVHRKVRIITLNASIVLYTTLALLAGGWIYFFVAEFDHSLAVHQTDFGKFTTAAFHAVTPRTAGFNTVDYSQLAIPSILVVIFLMWVGASPASTGGGIKTSTFALATLNILATARGKNRIQIFGRRISADSTSRAFAILCISLIVIGTSVLALLLVEPAGTDLLAVTFECFSAYSTVGLTLNYTPKLSEPGKYVIMAVMFVGRIGMLNLMIGLLRQINHQFFEYPKENILIN